jgi:hypothetical protein
MSAATTDTKKVNPLMHFIAGGLGGTVGAVLTCPLEVVKTRMQTSMYRKESEKGALNMIKYIPNELIN